MIYQGNAVSSTGPKQAIYENLAEVAQALGHPHRLELLEHLAQGVRSVEELSARAHLTFANTSRHLQILRRARLVDTERRGKHVLYRLAGDTEVVALIKALGRVGERNIAEIGRVVTDYFHARDALDPVSRDDLVARLRDDLVTVLDVRPEDEFALAELERRLGELPKGHEVIAYCRGPYCVLSFEAVAALRARGYRVRRLEDGYPEWKAAGLPIEAVA
jgi:DNA-binding transcriptional ArsR family regulator